MKKGNGGVVGAVRAIAAPLAEELGYFLWDVEYVKEGSKKILRITIDSEEGIDINLCEKFHRTIDPMLDEADPIEQAYFLEVSSPGVERDLVRDEHFTAYIGEKIKVKMIRPVEGKREFSGILSDYSDGNITISFEDESGFTFTKKEASWIKVDDFDM